MSKRISFISKVVTNGINTRWQDLQKCNRILQSGTRKRPELRARLFGLSASYGVLGNTYLPPNEAYPKAKIYAAKALAIDDTLAEAHTSLGANELYYDWDWAEAEERIQTRPNARSQFRRRASTIRRQFGNNRAFRRSAGEKKTLARTRSAIAGIQYGWRRDVLFCAAEPTKRSRNWKKQLASNRIMLSTYFYLGKPTSRRRCMRKRLPHIKKESRKPNVIRGCSPRSDTAYALNGEREKANKMLDELREMSKSQYISPYLFAVVYARFGR